MAENTTMIQRNYYERLHFYMDSCAISPVDSLFEVEKKSLTTQNYNVYWEFCPIESVKAIFGKICQILANLGLLKCGPYVKYYFYGDS